MPVETLQYKAIRSRITWNQNQVHLPQATVALCPGPVHCVLVGPRPRGSPCPHIRFLKG